MRTRLWSFVTILGLAALLGCGASTGGGGGGGAIYCGIGGACPAGFSCNANNFCIIGSADAGITDTGSKADTQAQDTTTGATDAVSVDTVPPSDIKVDTGMPDTGPPDTGAPDVQSSEQTLSQVQQAETSANCLTPDAIVDSASDVTLELVVVTSPPTKLKGSGGLYFTSFFATPQSGAASDGSWAGIQVIVNADPFAVSIGDVLRIKGTVKEFYCMTEITAKPEDVTIYGNEGQPTPHTVLVSKFADTTGAEPLEGGLIQLTNVQVLDPNPLSTDGKNHGECTVNHNGGSAYVTFAPALGSVYLTPGASGTTTTFFAGQGFASITGNLQWSFGHWVVRVRSDVDIIVK